MLMMRSMRIAMRMMRMMRMMWMMWMIRMMWMRKLRKGESNIDVALIEGPLPGCRWIEQAPAMRNPVYENHHQLTTNTQSHPLYNKEQDEQLSQDI
jgi:hypothetical protein